MGAAPDAVGLKTLRGAAFVLIASLLPGASPCLAAGIHVNWASNGEADLAGYRLRYGTAPGAYAETIEAGLANSVAVSGLETGRTYHFALFAYDEAGNESPPSGEVTARIPPSLASIPLVESAGEVGSRSIYTVRALAMFIMVYGDHFGAGAVVDLGTGVGVGPPVRTPTGDLLVRVDVAPTAPLGSRTLTVTNPDQGIGSRSDTLVIVKNPDIDSNCIVDVMDLNTFARAWNETGDESRYLAGADFDDDGYVGPEDLTILIQYFGRVFTSCP